jgi:hypothetical protein
MKDLYKIDFEIMPKQQSPTLAGRLMLPTNQNLPKSVPVPTLKEKKNKSALATNCIYIMWI